jgi:hypothetical protein
MRVHNKVGEKIKKREISIRQGVLFKFVCIIFVSELYIEAIFTTYILIE